MNTEHSEVENERARRRFSYMHAFRKPSAKLRNHFLECEACERLVSCADSPNKTRRQLCCRLVLLRRPLLTQPVFLQELLCGKGTRMGPFCKFLLLGKCTFFRP